MASATIADYKGIPKLRLTLTLDEAVELNNGLAYYEAAADETIPTGIRRLISRIETLLEEHDQKVDD